MPVYPFQTYFYLRKTETSSTKREFSVTASFSAGRLVITVSSACRQFLGQVKSKKLLSVQKCTVVQELTFPEKQDWLNYRLCMNEFFYIFESRHIHINAAQSHSIFATGTVSGEMLSKHGHLFKNTFE